MFVSVEEAGGKCLPCVVDIREEAQVIDAVKKAVEKFGGIDILVNNASAISLTGTEHTDMKRYDLMHSINTRGTFLVWVHTYSSLKHTVFILYHKWLQLGLLDEEVISSDLGITEKKICFCMCDRSSNLTLGSILGKLCTQVFPAQNLGWVC